MVKDQFLKLLEEEKNRITQELGNYQLQLSINDFNKSGLDTLMEQISINKGKINSAEMQKLEGLKQ